MVMLIAGSTGWLYGALIGAAVYMVLENRLSAGRPEFWQFGIAAVLVAVVLVVRRGGWGGLRGFGGSCERVNGDNRPAAAHRGAIDRRYAKCGFSIAVQHASGSYGCPPYRAFRAHK
jgi:hypothetical protein